MSKNRVSIREVLLWIFAVIPVVVMMYSSRTLPARCVIFIDVANVCHYGTKAVLWLLSIVPMLFAACITVYACSDKKEERQNANIQRIALAVIIFMLGYMAALLFRSFNVDIIDIYNLICFSVSILFATLGSALLRKDNSLDVKNAWTVSDIRVLEKTNTLAGNMCVIGGLIQALGSVILGRKHLFYVMILVFMVCLIIPNVMSYVWYKKYSNNRKR